MGVIAQIKSTEVKYLSSSVESCPCNVTLSVKQEVKEVEEPYSFLDGIANISYMWYSMIGCLLTVFLGYVFSVIIETISRRQILKITSQAEIKGQEAYRSSADQKSSSHHEGRIASFITHVVHDVEQQASNMENKIKNIISHTNLAHLHHDMSEDKLGILNEDTVQSVKCVGKDSGTGKLFFIGLFDEPNNQKSDNQQQQKSFESAVPHGEINPALKLDE